MKANDHQVGGTHYKGSAYEHWDLVVRTGMGYLEGQATRYITRWRKKNGLEDLQKAVHYIDKLIEVNAGGARGGGLGSDLMMLAEIKKFALANGLSPNEHFAVEDLAIWRSEKELVRARDIVLSLIEHAEPKPVPVSDSNKHAERAK